MPTLYPSILLSHIKQKDERRVVEKLMQKMPSDCLIFHGFETLQWKPKSASNSQLVLREGEIDVVVFWPDRGFMVLEVKGGGIKCVDGIWTSEGRKGTFRISNPFAQAKKNMHSIENLLMSTLGLGKMDLGIARAYGAVFPGARYDGPIPSDAALPADASTDILCDQRKFDQIGRFVKKAMVSFSGEETTSSTTVTATVFKEVLLPQFKMVRCLSTQVENDGEEFLRLTDAQSVVLDILSEQKQVAIKGVAGSGKTLLAAEQARRLTSQGKRTLVLCFNQALAQWLKKLIDGGVGSSVDVFAFHDFCQHVARRAGHRVNVPVGNAGQSEMRVFFNEHCPDLLSTYAEAGGGVYDAIIVDEGQDFHEHWWLAIDECLAEGGHLYVFHDEQQNLFRADGLSALESIFKLHTVSLNRNCRNTQSIAEFFFSICGVDAHVSPHAPRGRDVEMQVEKDQATRKTLAISVLRGWLKEDNLEPSSIAVISPYKIENSSLGSLNGLKNIPLVNTVEQWRANEGILFATARAIKGLEADVVLLIDIPKPDTQAVFTTADFYVACSRARSHLHVIASEQLDAPDKLAA